MRARSPSGGCPTRCWWWLNCRIPRRGSSSRPNCAGATATTTEKHQRNNGAELPPLARRRIMLRARRLRPASVRHNFAASAALWRRVNGGRHQPRHGNKDTRMSASAKRSVTLSLDGSNKSASLPLLEATIGPPVADIRKIYGDLGIFTYDPGYGATASCESKITYIDGDEGILLYRGYPIEQLAEKSTFLEICYLLLNGELPNAKEREEFDLGVMRHTMLHEQLRTFYNGFRRDAHPMAVMCGVVGALSAFYHDSLDIHDPESRRISAFRLVAK